MIQKCLPFVLLDWFLLDGNKAEKILHDSDRDPLLILDFFLGR